MDIALWIAQVVLALLFLMAAFTKLTQNKASLKEKIGGWTENVSLSLIRVIGIVELAGAAGLIFPLWLDVMPILTPVAAAGLGVTMMSAAILHFKRKERKEMGMNIIILFVAIFVTVGRLVILPVV